MARQKSTEFERFLAILSPPTRTLLQPARKVDVTRVDELSTRPRWWLAVVPDGDAPELSSYVDENELLAAVRDAYELELGHLFVFHGTRALTADQMHGASAIPYLVFPGGRIFPLFERAQKLQLRKDGFVGDPAIEEFLYGDPADDDTEYDPLEADNGRAPGADEAPLNPSGEA